MRTTRQQRSAAAAQLVVTAVPCRAPQAVDLHHFLPQTQALLQTVLGRRVRLVVAVAPATWPVLVDGRALELALVRLLLNARQAAAGEGCVWVHARNAEPLELRDDARGLCGRVAGHCVLLTVTDDGSGMDESLVLRAFDPGGAGGLGLRQVRDFCAQAGGTARLASTPGLGTAVSMLLPARA